MHLGLYSSLLCCCRLLIWPPILYDLYPTSIFELNPGILHLWHPCLCDLDPRQCHVASIIFQMVLVSNPVITSRTVLQPVYKDVLLLWWFVLFNEKSWCVDGNGEQVPLSAPSLFPNSLRLAISTSLNARSSFPSDNPALGASAFTSNASHSPTEC